MSNNLKFYPVFERVSFGSGILFADYFEAVKFMRVEYIFSLVISECVFADFL